jgi:hypothetical protein
MERTDNSPFSILPAILTPSVQEAFSYQLARRRNAKSAYVRLGIIVKSYTVYGRLSIGLLSNVTIVHRGSQISLNQF